VAAPDDTDPRDCVGWKPQPADLKRDQVYSDCNRQLVRRIMQS
jgi:predicted Abi (CAAX) family protease